MILDLFIDFERIKQSSRINEELDFVRQIGGKSLMSIIMHVLILAIIPLHVLARNLGVLFPLSVLLVTLLLSILFFIDAIILYHEILALEKCKAMRSD